MNGCAQTRSATIWRIIALSFTLIIAAWGSDQQLLSLILGCSSTKAEADVNIEYQANAKLADAAMILAHKFQLANDKYASDYPATVGPHMTNTDSTPFMDLTPAISLRENERGAQLGQGWDPQHHQPTDVYTTYKDEDFRLGLNAAQTTLGAIAQLTGAMVTESK